MVKMQERLRGFDDGMGKGKGKGRPSAVLGSLRRTFLTGNERRPGWVIQVA